MSSTGRFRFALQATHAPDLASWTEQVRWAEASGFDTLSLPDHIMGQLSPVPALAAAAAVSSHIKLATFVLANDFRHPALVAKEAATLDLLSGGRLELGLGAGWLEDEYRRIGIPFRRPSERIDRMVESVEIIRRLFAGGVVDYAGEHYNVRDLELAPTPPQGTNLPLILGGGGPKILGHAGRLADIVSIATGNSRRVVLGGGPDLLREDGSTAALRRSVEAVRVAAGSRLGSIELNLRIIVAAVTSDPRGLAAALGATMQMTAEEVLASPFALLGSVPQIAERLVWLREEFGFTYFTVSGSDGPSIAPVISRLAGS